MKVVAFAIARASLGVNIEYCHICDGQGIPSSIKSFVPERCTCPVARSDVEWIPESPRRLVSMTSQTRFQDNHVSAVRQAMAMRGLHCFSSRSSFVAKRWFASASDVTPLTADILKYGVECLKVRAFERDGFLRGDISYPGIVPTW